MLVMLQTLNLASHPTGTHHYASKHDLKDSVHAEVMAYCPVRDFYDFMVPNPTASQELLNLRRRDSPKPRNWSSYSPYRSEWRNRAVDLCATIFTWSTKVLASNWLVCQYNGQQIKWTLNDYHEFLGHPMIWMAGGMEACDMLRKGRHLKVDNMFAPEKRQPTRSKSRKRDWE